jgi:hypothetical protein
MCVIGRPRRRAARGCRGAGGAAKCVSPIGSDVTVVTVVTHVSVTVSLNTSYSFHVKWYGLSPINKIKKYQDSVA